MYLNIIWTFHIKFTVFKNDFNMKFGFSRSDTCSECDSLQQKLAVDQRKKKKETDLAKRKLHLRKAEAFFEAKRRYKMKAKAGEIVCILCRTFLCLIYQLTQCFILVSFGIMFLISMILVGIYTYHKWQAKGKWPMRCAPCCCINLIIILLHQEPSFW